MTAIFAFIALAAIDPAQAEDDDPFAIGDKFARYDVVALHPDAVRADAADGRLTLRMFGANHVVFLDPQPQILALDVHRLEVGGMAAFEKTATLEIYQGVLADDSDARALVTISDDGVDGSLIGGGMNLYFETARYYDQDAPVGLSIAYHAWDVILPEDAETGEIDVAEPVEAPAELAPVSHNPGPDRDLQMWADSAMLAAFGSAWITKVSNVYAQMNSWFESEVAFQFYTGNVYYCNNSSCDSDFGMTSTNIYTLLPSWSSRIDNCGNCDSYELAHLMSGKEMNGGTIGLAYRPGRYGVSQMVDAGGSYQGGSSNYEASILMMHEIGHNFNGQHERASSYSHNHPYTVTVCDFSIFGICLSSHPEQRDDYWTHYTTMWTPFSHQPSAKKEMLGEFSSTSTSTNYYWLRSCNGNGGWPSTSNAYCTN